MIEWVIKSSLELHQVEVSINIFILHIMLQITEGIHPRKRREIKYNLFVLFIYNLVFNFTNIRFIDIQTMTMRSDTNGNYSK